MKKTMAFFQNPSKGLALALILILVGSFFANVFNTSFYQVDVTRISFETEKGTLSGLLYMPDGASADDPRPTIVTTHGYLNSAEMQDAPAIEMSKRGFVVLALDMYDHGHSMTKLDTENAAAFFSFWPTALNDAVQYIYDQDYVKKDEAGNGLIAVSGHSMGGFSTTMAMVMDEQGFAQTGIRKIHAGLTVGADFLWTSYLEVTGDVAGAAIGPRISGKIAAHYDEFFFDMVAAAESKTVVQKDYLKQAEGLAFLGNPENPVPGEFYSLENGGLRVIYTPNETHPWNHFSKETTGNQIDFYQKAFEGKLSENQTNVDADSQTWFFKELFELVAMIGFFMLFVPLAAILVQKVKWLQTEQQNATSTVRKMHPAFLTLIVIISAGFPAYFYPTLMGKIPEKLLWLQRGAEVFIVLSAVALISSFVIGQFKTKSNTIISALALIFAIFGRVLMNQSAEFFKSSSYFNAPTLNQFGFWAVSSAVFAVLFMAVIHFITSSKDQTVTLDMYGLTKKPMDILKGFCLAVILLVSGIVILFVVDALFKTDFRFWTFAVKTFNAKHMISALGYMPIFFLFYLVNGIAIHKTTLGLKFGKSIAVLMNVGGLILFLALQYGMLFATGTGIDPTQSLTSIILIGIVPVLLIAALFTKKLTEKTGNIYTSVFFNTMLMTLISVANTVVYSKLV